MRQAPTEPQLLISGDVESFNLLGRKDFASGVGNDTQPRLPQSIFEVIAVPANVVALAKSDRVLLGCEGEVFVRWDSAPSRNLTDHETTRSKHPRNLRHGGTIVGDVLEDVKVKHNVDALVTKRQIHSVSAHIGIAKIHQIGSNILDVGCEPLEHVVHLWLGGRVKNRLCACKNRPQTTQRQGKKAMSFQ